MSGIPGAGGTTDRPERLTRPARRGSESALLLRSPGIVHNSTSTDYEVVGLSNDYKASDH